MTESDKRLFLLDGMALIYRAHFVFIRNPITTSTGLNTSAVFGYVNTLLDIIGNQSPTHIAVAFDTPEPTHRHEEFPEYKADREEMPEDLSRAIPWCHEITEAFRIPVLLLPGYEADDIVGALVKRAEQEDFESYMVTPDKDFSQLVSERTFLYRPGRRGDAFEIWGPEEVCERWGIERPEQVIDILGLAGDKVDGIPGVPGIGEKTAQKLIAQFGSVEGVLENVAQLRGKQRENVEQHADQARLSKRLATIDVEAPIDTELDSLARSEPDAEKLQELFRRFEFRTLGRRLFGEDWTLTGEAPAQPSLFTGQALVEAPAESTDVGVTHHSLADTPHDYRLAGTEAERSQLLAELMRTKRFSFDIETSGLDFKRADIVGFAFSTAPHTGWYAPFPDDPAQARHVLAEFQPLLEDPEVELTGHNLKFDLGILRWHGIRFRGTLFDTMFAHILVEPSRRHTLDHLAETYLDYQPMPISQLIGEKGKGQKNLRDVPVQRVAEYATEDADVALQLRSVLEPLLDQFGARRVFAEAECPLVPALVEMEYAGITLDVAALEEYSHQLAEEAAELQARIYDLAGTEFNLNSPKQIGEVFFDRLQLEDKPKRTRTGQYATNERVLQRLSGRHEIVRLLLEHRQVVKLKSTYVDSLPGTVFARTGRVHTNYNQLVTATGRMQSHGPNLQNIPIRDERGQEIRKAFVARGPEYTLLSADYSQIELRIIAALSRDETMLAAFRDGEDIHRATAARVYHVAPDTVTDEQRRKAKVVNFGIAYGISAFGLADRLNISRTEAREIIDEYFRQFPGIRRYMDETIEFCRRHGYVETVLGRRRYLSDIDSRNNTVRSAAERNAINSPIQGTAADMIKLAMVRIHGELMRRELRTKMLLQIHDELVFDLHREEEEEVRALVHECMTTALPLEAPIEVEMDTGDNWFAAH